MTAAFTYDALPQERVHFGKSVRDALGAEVERLGAKRVFIATSKTLHRQTGAISLLTTTLGAKCVGIFDDIAEHSKLDGVLAATRAAREASADLLVLPVGLIDLGQGLDQKLLVSYRGHQFSPFIHSHGRIAHASRSLGSRVAVPRSFA